MFDKHRGLHGSPRLVLDLRDDGWTVSERNSHRTRCAGKVDHRKIKRRNGLTQQDKSEGTVPRT